MSPSIDIIWREVDAGKGFTPTFTPTPTLALRLTDPDRNPLLFESVPPTHHDVGRSGCMCSE